MLLAKKPLPVGKTGRLIMQPQEIRSQLTLLLPPPLSRPRQKRTLVPERSISTPFFPLLRKSTLQYHQTLRERQEAFIQVDVYTVFSPFHLFPGTALGKTFLPSVLLSLRVRKRMKGIA